jgi:hypothetical protein
VDNMQVRKAQLEKLDDFVHTLFKECETFETYGMNMKDLKMLYQHIHELIQEMLQAKNTDEFLAMIEDFHRAVAGILIIAVPADAGQIMQDMNETYEDFQGQDFDEMLKNLHKTSVQKHGKKSKVNPKTPKQPEEDADNDPDELLRMMDLEEHAKRKGGGGTHKKRPTPEPQEEASDDEEDVEFGGKSVWDDMEDDNRNHEDTEIKFGDDPYDDVYKNY